MTKRIVEIARPLGIEDHITLSVAGTAVFVHPRIFVW
jgi:hypothetical protein